MRDNDLSYAKLGLQVGYSRNHIRLISTRDKVPTIFIQQCMGDIVDLDNEMIGFSPCDYVDGKYRFVQYAVDKFNFLYGCNVSYIQFGYFIRKRETRISRAIQEKLYSFFEIKSDWVTLDTRS